MAEGRRECPQRRRHFRSDDRFFDPRQYRCGRCWFLHAGSDELGQRRQLRNERSSDANSGRRSCARQLWIQRADEQSGRLLAAG